MSSHDTIAVAADAQVMLPRLGAQPGDRVGPWLIRSVLGRGGMGTVFKAEREDGAIVALKLLRGGSDDERRRSRREAGYLQALRHPGIVRVLDQGEDRGLPWMAMELVDGERFDALVDREHPLPPMRAADLLLQALEALHCAHLAGILHRDVKPANLLVRSDGTVVLVDFGLARRLDRETRLTRSGAVVGTPAYMSPEQAAGDDAAVGVGSDIYAMGAVLYELLTGQEPFQAENPAALLRVVIEEDFPDPCAIRRDLPPDLVTVLLKAVAKHPSDRYASAEAFASDLRRILAGRRVQARRLGWIRPFARACGRHRRGIAVGGLVAFLLAAGTAISIRHALRLRDQLAAKSAEAESAWTEVGRWRGPFQPPAPPRALPDAAGAARALYTLPRVPGPVRITAVFTPDAERTWVELLVNDRDVGQGYALRIEAERGGVRLRLLRRGHGVAEQRQGGYYAGPLRLSLTREGEALTASAAWQHEDGEPDRVVRLRFLDLTPIEGPEADGAYVVAPPGTPLLSDLRLERQRSGVLVSALTAANLLRQDGRYNRALELYEDYLRDHAGGPEAIDARLRAAMCLDGLGDHQGAFDRFLALSKERIPERFALAASFHAWRLAAQLGRMDDADRMFQRLRDDYPVATLLSYIPEQTVRDILASQLQRAAELADRESVRAERIYSNAVELCDALGLADQRAIALSASGAIAIHLGDLASARARFQRIADDQALALPERVLGLIRVAESARLAGDRDEALARYDTVLALPGVPPETARLARFWRADLLIDLARPADARAELQELRQGGDRAAAFARAMLAGVRPDLPGDRWFANDAAYVEARGALLANERERWRARLADAQTLGSPGDWPSPLARRMLIDDTEEPDENR